MLKKRIVRWHRFMGTIIALCLASMIAGAIMATVSDLSWNWFGCSIIATIVSVFIYFDFKPDNSIFDRDTSGDTKEGDF